MWQKNMTKLGRKRAEKRWRDKDNKDREDRDKSRSTTDVSGRDLGAETEVWRPENPKGISVDYDDDGTPPPSIGPFGATTAPPDSPKFVPPTTRPSSTTTAALLVYEKKRQNEGEGVGRMKPSSGRRTGMERIPANAQSNRGEG